MIKKISYFIVALKFNSNLGVARTFSAVLRCLEVKFNVFTKRLLDQFLSVSSKLVGPYNGGGGVQVFLSSAKIYVCSDIRLLVGGLRLYTGVALTLPGWSDGNVISGMKDVGDSTVFLGGAKEFDTFN